MMNSNNSNSCIINKCILILLSVLVFSVLFANTEVKAQTWQRMKMMLPDGYSLLSNSKVTFATKDLGWLTTIGTDPSSNTLVSWLFKTTDGGDSWSYQSNTVGSVFVLDSSHIWMRSGNFILVAKNGGQSVDSLECLIPFDKWYFSDQNNGIAIATWLNKQWFTDDGGKSWYIGDTTMYFGSITDIDFPSPTHGWVVGDKPPFGADYGMIASTVDRGKTWGYQALFPPIHSPRLNGVCFIDSINGFAIGIGLMRTTDGGRNWTYNSTIWGGSISFLSRKIGFCNAGYGLIAVTTDSGNSWNTTETGTDALFMYVKALKNDGNVFAFGQNLAQEFILVRLDANKITNIDRRQDSEPDRFEIIDAYPNPIHDALTVSFICTENTPVTVRVYSILGTEITREVLEYADAGTRYWNWLPNKRTQIAAGPYILTMHSGNSYSSKLLTVLP